MKCLVVYCHPNAKSFNSAIAAETVKALEAAGNEVRLRDLYALGFDPVLSARDFEALSRGQVPPDVKAEQSHIAWADLLVFVHPVWWAGMPALLKGYVDRVFLKGFAYDYAPEGVVPLLKGKKALFLSTSGTPSQVYAVSGMHDSMRQVQDEGIMGFCGIQVSRHEFFGGVPFSTPEERQEILKRLPGLL